MSEEASLLELVEGPLPGSSLNKTEAEGFIKNILYRELPRSDTPGVEKSMRWCFTLEKHSKETKRKKKNQKKTYLTRKERKDLNLLKLPKTGWNYTDLEDIREMWKDYMRENLEMAKAPSCTHPDYSSLNIILGKSEYVGAEVEVVRSTCPSVVGIHGTVVLETKATFHVITRQSKLKMILKENSVFEINLDNMKFTVFGKHLVTKPSERSVKKIKTFMCPDL